MERLFQKGEIVHLYSNKVRVRKNFTITVVGYTEDGDLYVEAFGNLDKITRSLIWNPKNVYAVGDAPDFDVEHYITELTIELSNLEHKFNQIMNVLPTSTERENVCDARILVIRAKSILISLVGK